MTIGLKFIQLTLKYDDVTHVTMLKNSSLLIYIVRHILCFTHSSFTVSKEIAMAGFASKTSIMYAQSKFY